MAQHWEGSPKKIFDNRQNRAVMQIQWEKLKRAAVHKGTVSESRKDPLMNGIDGLLINCVTSCRRNHSELSNAS